MSDKMKVKILQRGGNKRYHPVLEKAIRHYASQLFSTRMANSLSIRLEFRVGKNTKCRGVVYHNTNGSKIQKEWKIVIGRDIDLLHQLIILAHEMKHVQQGVSKRLQFFKNKDKILRARWEGETMIVKDVPYNKRPWEIEAYAEQIEIFDKFASSAITLK